MYSQKRYDEKLGTCKVTIASHGCFITAICNYLEYIGYKKRISPPEMNQLCIEKNGYYAGCNLIAPALAHTLGFEYQKTTNIPQVVCIAETDHYRKYGVPQHFFVFNPKNNKRIDSLDINPNWEYNDYKIVSYRIFNSKEEVEDKPEEIKIETMKVDKKLKDVGFKYGYDFGENLNEKEMPKVGELVEAIDNIAVFNGGYVTKFTDLQEEYEGLKIQTDADKATLNEEISTLKTQLAEAKKEKVVELSSATLGELVSAVFNKFKKL